MKTSNKLHLESISSIKPRAVKKYRWVTESKVTEIPSLKVSPQTSRDPQKFWEDVPGVPGMTKVLYSTIN